MNSKIILIAACGAALLASCNKGDTPKSLPTPAQDQAACTITPKSNDVEINVGGKTLLLGSVEFYRSGRYSIDTIIEREVVPNSTKADSPTNHYVYTGTYTESNGVYSLSGDITTTMTVNANEGTLQSALLSTSIQITVIPGKVTSAGSLEDLMFRSWAIKTLNLNMNNGSIEKKWDFTDNKNVSVVAAYLKEKKVNIDVAKFSKYDVKEISFGTSSISVSFTDTSVSDFYGSFNLSGTIAQATFIYNLSDVLPEDNPFLNAKAKGKVAFKGNDLVLSLDVSTDELVGTMELTLAVAN